MRRSPTPHRWALALLLSVAAGTSEAQGQELTLRFFDVGQGDAALITTPEGRSVLIDGSNTAGWPAYLLDSLGVDTVALVVASHAHADHIKGLLSVLETTVVQAYMDNGLPATTSTYRALMEAVRAKGVQYLAATPRTISLGTTSLRVLPIPPGKQSQNNSSVGLLLTYGSFTAIFTGDAESKERTYWLGYSDLPHVTVLKVAHHGAQNGTDPAWLRLTSPRVAVISVGARNGYRHPSSGTLRALAEAGAAVYRTDRDGDVTIVVDSTGMVEVEASRRSSVQSFSVGTVPGRE